MLVLLEIVRIGQCKSKFPEQKTTDDNAITSVKVQRWYF